MSICQADLDRPLHVLVLAEDWCGDVIANLPVLGRLAAESGTFDVVVDGELIHSMYRDGGFPASATIIDAVRARLAA